MSKDNVNNKKAFFHLPGLFEYYNFYKEFLPLFFSHREYFYSWCEIGSIYGAPSCIWNGGRESWEETSMYDVIKLMSNYNISSRLTFSNSLINEEHLDDFICNSLCKEFSSGNNGVIIYSDILLNYIKEKYPSLYFVSSTTKVILDHNDFINELNRSDFKYVVPDFRLNKNMDLLKSLSLEQKNKIELLCNECCYIGCKDRKACYEAVSRINLELDSNHVCKAPDLKDGYRFSLAKKNPSFISVDDIINTYIPLGITNFKIEGRGLGSALLLEFILYYMTKPEYELNVREELYLSNSLDLF